MDSLPYIDLDLPSRVALVVSLGVVVVIALTTSVMAVVVVALAERFSSHVRKIKSRMRKGVVA